MAEHLTNAAARIETDDEPGDLVDAVHRARLALRGLRYERDTYTRLVVMEALDRATAYCADLPGFLGPRLSWKLPLGSFSVNPYLS